MAGPYYVKSGTGGTTGADWANAVDTLLEGLALASAGETVYVSSTHSESASNDLTLTNSGTHNQPIYVISVTDSAEPPVTYTPGAVVSRSGLAYYVRFAGFVRSYGVHYRSGESLLVSGDVGWHWYDCELELGTASNRTLTFQNADSHFVFDGVTFKFNHTLQDIYAGGGNTWRFRNCDIDATTKPVNLMFAATSEGGYYEFDCCDFTNLTTTGTVIGTLPSTASGGNSVFLFNRCKLDTNQTVTSDTADAAMMLLEANYTADTDYYRLDNLGTVTSDTTVFLSSDSSFSLKMETSSPGTPEVGQRALRCMLGEVYANANDELTIHGLIDEDPLSLKEDEFWIEVCYGKTADANFGQTATTRPANIGLDAAPDTVTADTANNNAWTDNAASVTNEAEFKITVDLGTATPANASGIVQVWLNLAKPSTEVWIDSKIELAAS